MPHDTSGKKKTAFATPKLSSAVQQLALSSASNFVHTIQSQCTQRSDYCQRCIGLGPAAGGAGIIPICMLPYMAAMG